MLAGCSGKRAILIEQIFFGIVIILYGIFLILGSFSGSRLFMSQSRVKQLAGCIGFEGARLFFAALGYVCIGCGLFALLTAF